MSDTNNKIVADKLAELKTELLSTVQRAHRRNMRALVVSMAIIALLAGYLVYAYQQFATVDPDFAADFTQSQLETYMPEASAELEKSLKDNAPKVIAELEARVTQMPEILADRMKSQTLASVDEKMPEVQEEVHASLSASLIQASGNLPAGTDEERFAALLQKLKLTAGDQVDSIHAKYAIRSRDFINYLDVLAVGQNLDREQQLHRDMLRTFFILVREYDRRGGKTNVTSLWLDE